MPNPNAEIDDDDAPDDEYDDVSNIEEHPVSAPAPVGVAAPPVQNGHTSGRQARANNGNGDAAAPRRRGRPPGRLGGAAVPGPVPTLGHDVREVYAHLVWEEMLEKLRESGVHPSLVKIYVTRIDPAPDYPLGDFTGDACDSASSFYSYIVNNYHARSTMKGPAKYQCRFSWKGSGRFVKVAVLPLPPMEELVAMGTPKQFGAQGSMSGAPYQPQGYPQQPPVYGAPQGPQLGYFPQQQAWALPPQQQQQAQAPAAAPAPQGFGAPPTGDPQVAELRAQVAYLSGQLTSVLGALSPQNDPRATAAVAAAQAQPPPQQSAAGLAGPPTVDQIATAVLRMMGHTPVAPAVAVAAPPPSAAAAAGLTEMRAMVETFKALKGVFRDFDDAFAPDEPPPAEQAIVTAPAEGAKLPFDVIPLGTDDQPVMLWGHRVHITQDPGARGFGAIDWAGMAFHNPGAIEKIGDIVSKLAESLPGIAKQLGLGAPPAPAPAPAPASPFDNSGLDFGDDAAGAGAAPGPGPGAVDANGWPVT